jgi:hypothetical protein
VSDLDIARALELEILGGEPFNYPCGCFGVIVEVHKYNADWVRVMRKRTCGQVFVQRHRGEFRQQHLTPASYVPLWRKRNGDFISEAEWDEHTGMSSYVYGKRER